jgi:hypothetical protein
VKRYPLIAFMLVFLGQAVWLSLQAARTASLWGTRAGGEYAAGVRAYLSSGDWWLGLSYGLSAAFVTYAFIRLRTGQQAGAAGMAGGISLIGVLYFAGCFLLGCCGSPMLIVYFSLFGASFLGFTKPLVFALTLASITLGYLWMERRAKTACAACACDTGACEEDATSP